MQIPVFSFLLTTLMLTAGGYNPRPDLDGGRYLKAMAEADAVLKTEPGNALALSAKAQALSAMMRFPEALVVARKAAELQPGLADALLARALARAGTALQEKNLSSLSGVSESMDDLRAAVSADPGLTAAWMALGVGYEQLPGLLGGSTNKALECADALGRSNPAKGAVLRGTILAMGKKWTKAQASFATALAKAPHDPDVVFAYLDALGSRDTRKAIGDAEQKRLLAQEAHRLLPVVKGRARAIAGVCDALIDAGQGEEAWTTAQAALAGADAPSLLRLELGKISARTGVHREQGLACLDQVLREPLEGGTGGYGTAHWRRGQILKDLGRKDEARAAAKAALALDPKDGKAQGLLKDLS